MAQWRVPAWWPPWPQSQPTHFPGCLSAQGTTGKRSGGQGVGQAGTGSLLSRLVGGELRALMASRAQGAGQSVSPTESRLYPLPAGGDAHAAVRMGYPPAFRQPRSVTFMIILLFQYSHDVSGRSGPGFRRFRPKENSGRSAGVLCH